MIPYIIIAAVLVLLVIVLLSRSRSQESTTGSSDNDAGQAYDKVDKEVLFNALVADGYTRKDSSYSIKFSKDFEANNCRVEMELSLVKKKETSLDIDVYKKGFNIQLPDNVSPSFFEHVVFQNYNKILKESSNMELLPNVQEGGYYLRSSSKHLNWKLPNYSSLQANIQERLTFFDDFPFITQEDYEQPFFQQLVEDGYQSHFAPQQMLLRFSKPINEENLSFYYVKALNMSFLAASKLTDAAIQEDFRDDQTKLHHFAKEEELEDIDINDNSEESELAEQEEESSLAIFPTFEEFKAVEAEFIADDEEDEDYDYEEDYDYDEDEDDYDNEEGDYDYDTTDYYNEEDDNEEDDIEDEDDDIEDEEDIEDDDDDDEEEEYVNNKKE